DLAQTADYADIATLETVELCDDVRVYYEKLGVDTTAKVIKTKWNVLRDAYDEIEIGEKRTTLSSIINDTQTSIKEIGNQMDSAITAANGKNMIFHGLFGKNGEGEPTATRVGDMWYKPSGEDIEFYIWDGTVWTFIMSTAKFDEIANKVSEVESDTKRAVEKANNIQINVNHLVSDISAMNRDISTISFKASEAYS
ncbi:phage tail protein, partial [Enterococcus gallinarum]